MLPAEYTNHGQWDWSTKLAMSMNRICPTNFTQMSPPNVPVKVAR